MVVCVLYPRFELLAALGDRRALLSEPAALAPEAGREQVVGEVSAPAEAFGVVRGMRLGEALARCPALRLVPPDPEGSRSLWGHVLDRLEGIGAAVESDRAGVAFFEAGGSRACTAATSPGCWRPPAGRWARARASGRRPVASRPTPRRSGRPRRGAGAGVGSAGRGAMFRVVEEHEPREFLAPLPVSLLRTRPELAGAAGAPRAARDQDARASLPSFRARGWPSASAIRGCWPSTWPADATPRSSRDGRPSRCCERLDLPEAASGQQLERALELLVARVLARRERRGRALRGLSVSARFVAGGTWRIAVTLRSASADPGSDPTRARPQAGRAAGAGGVAGAGGGGIRAARRRIRAGCSTRRRRSGAAAWARPSARRARRRARRPL